MRQRIIGAVLATSLVTCLPGAQAADDQRFSDVSSSYFAYRPIAKLAAQGVISGRGNGIFAPTDSVSHLEALVMALRLSESATLNTDAASLTLQQETRFGGNVPLWGKGYLAAANDKGLLDADETFNWNSGASRAWVAKILIKMIGQQADALGRANNTLNFVDSSQIGGWSRGYISIASELNLIKGYEDGTFRPNQAVTRAEMAILLDKAQQKLDKLPEKLKTGSVVKAYDTYLSLLDSNNALIVVPLSVNAQAFIEEKPALLTDLQPKDQILYIDDSGKASYVEVLQRPITNKNTIQGEVLLVNPDLQFLTLRNAEQVPETYPLATDYKVLTLLGQELTLNHVLSGLQIQANLNTDRAITEILIEQKTNQGNQGSIVEVNPSKNLLILKDDANRFLTYVLMNDANLEYEGRRFASFTDLQKGDIVKVESDSNQKVTKIMMVQPFNKIQLSGTISLIAKDSRIITIESEQGQLRAYQLSSSTPIELTNGSTVSFIDLLEGDPVTIYLTNGTVEKLVIDKKTLQSKLWAKLVTADSAQRLVVLKDVQDQLLSYEVDDTVFLDIEDETNPTLLDLTNDSYVNYEVENGKIVYLKATNSIFGEVTRLDPDRFIMTLRNETGTLKNYNIDNNVDIEVYDESNEELDDVKIGDYVKIRLSNDEISQIYVQKKDCW